MFKIAEALQHGEEDNFRRDDVERVGGGVGLKGKVILGEGE
jgi:hypothetical protein